MIEGGGGNAREMFLKFLKPQMQNIEQSNNFF